MSHFTVIKRQKSLQDQPKWKCSTTGNKLWFIRLKFLSIYKNEMTHNLVYVVAFTALLWKVLFSLQRIHFEVCMNLMIGTLSRMLCYYFEQSTGFSSTCRRFCPHVIRRFLCLLLIQERFSIRPIVLTTCFMNGPAGHNALLSSYCFHVTHYISDLTKRFTHH